MNDLNGDTPSHPDQGDPEDVEVVFVSDASSDSGRGIKTAPFELALDPEESGAADSSVSAESGLEAAREHLRNNELDDALSLAMETARLRPDLVEAKLIIARCFINRKEYRKAQAILQAIPDEGKNAETYYYLGLCRGRVNNVPGAVEALEKSLSATPDTIIRERAGDLLQHLRSGEAVCSECGQQGRYENMTDTGDKTVCAACADVLAKVVGKHATAGAVAVIPAGGGFLSGLARRLVLVPGLAALLYLLLHVFSAVVPARYEELRLRLPAAWTFLPKPVVPSHPITGSTEPIGDSVATLPLNSPVIEYAVAGIPLSRTLMVDGNVATGDSTVRFSPEPHGRYRMDGRTGQFSWTPGEGDAGGHFALDLDVTLKDGNVASQSNHVRVFSPPRFRRIYQPGTMEPDTISHLLSADCTANGMQEIVLVQGRYRGGRVTVLQETADGLFHPMGGLELSGRPAGAGLVNVDGETLVCVADYWNSVLRYFTLRDGAVAELSFTTRTPGRPVQAGFERDSGIAAALCQSETGMRLICHRIVDKSHVEKIGDWNVPDGNEYVWRRVLALPEVNEAGSRPRMLLAGGDLATSLFLFSPDNSEPVPVALGIPGTLMDAAVDSAGRVNCLVEEKGIYTLVTFTLDSAGRSTGVASFPVGGKPFLNGIASLNPFGSENVGKIRAGEDVALLSATRLGFALSGLGEHTTFVQWPLPSPSRLLGPAASLPGGKGEADRILYFDAEGTLWSAGFSERANK